MGVPDAIIIPSRVDGCTITTMESSPSQFWAIEIAFEAAKSTQIRNQTHDKSPRGRLCATKASPRDAQVTPIADQVGKEPNSPTP